MPKQGYLHGVKFLIVEDNAFMREILRELLLCFSVRNIQEAHDGADALEIMQTWTPDIILLDWEMVPFDGIDFARMVRASNHNDQQFTPIIMISAHSEYWRIQYARAAGINEFLVKPISPHALFSRICAVIDRPRPFIKTEKYFGPDRRRQDQTHTDECRHEIAAQERIPDDQSMAQKQINAIFNPGSEHPDDIVSSPATDSPQNKAAPTP